VQSEGVELTSTREGQLLVRDCELAAENQGGGEFPGGRLRAVVVAGCPLSKALCCWSKPGYALCLVVVGWQKDCVYRHDIT